MKEKIDEILAQYQGQRGVLIPILQKVQAEFRYLPEEALLSVARALKISESEVYGVASFYSQFRFVPQGEHVVKVCLGTACHVRGGQRILERVEDELGIKAGETTEDQKFSVEKIACFGSCSLAPVVVTDDTIHGRLETSKVKNMLSQTQ